MLRNVMRADVWNSLFGSSAVRRRLGRRWSARPAVELLEDRCLLAFSVLNADLFSTGGLRIVVDLNQPVDADTVQASDLVVDGTLMATSANVLDADSVEFFLPSLGAGTHSVSITGEMKDTQGTVLDPFTESFAIASAAQYTMKHNPRLQPGNAPLAGFAGGDLDRVDILWQTIPASTGTQDSFTVEYRAVGATAWQSTSLNAALDTGVEGRVVRSASITGLNWNSDYEYRVRYQQADVIVGQYTSAFHTRLAVGDESSFTFAAYGDSASGTATGFRQVQDRINQVDPAFAVLLGDNVYDAGTHQQSDARFDPLVNPEAAEWMAGHIDYLGLGNHDVATGAGLPAEQNYSVPIPVAGVTSSVAPAGTERTEHNFSWDYGDVHFVTFDTNSLADVTRLDGLLNWVVADLNASTARWKIVYGHHPLAGVPDKPENPSGNYYQQVVNRLKAAGVDLFMTGHSHTYAWTYPLTGQVNGTATYIDHGQDDQFLAGEGLPQLVSGLGGKEVRSGDFSTFPFVAEGFTSTTPVPGRFGFSQISVTQNQLTVDYVAADNGAVIDSFTITKDDAAQTASFQQGANGYTSTVDTYLHQNTPDTSFATATSVKVDNDDPAATGLDAQTLLRFDNLFGNGAGQIPTNATLRSATLQLQVTNGSVSNMNLHRMLGTWSSAATWNSLSSGVQADGIEAVAAPDTSSGASQAGKLSFNVLASLQAWLASPTSNFGWAILPTGTDGVDFNSSEGTTKPKLIVTYVVETGPNDPPIAVNDTATTNGNTAVTLSVLSNDSDPNGNALSVQSATTPAHGSVVINAGATVTYTPTIGYFSADTFDYTISDGQGGTATATVNLIVGQTVVFQQGLNGYTGTVDTFLQQNVSGANNSAAVSLNVDSDDPVGTGLDVQSLLRFDDLFGGGGAGQIPTNATLQSATLQVQVTNAGNSMNLHRMLANWVATNSWSTFTDGVQANGVEALAAADVASGAAGVGAFSINVLASLQAWLASPASNLGWALLPIGTDGVDFDSSEGTTKPKLTVFYVPVSNTVPTISDIADQTTDEDVSTGTLAFTIGDSETTVSSLTVTATSSNTTLVPNANLVFGGSDANRTLTATPAANQSGTATINVTVTDGNGATASDTFLLTVNAINDVPTISDIVSQSTNEDTATGSLAFTIGDVETTAGSLIVTATSSNTTLVANANLVLGGSSANRTLIATPVANQSGTTTITVTVTDGNGAMATDTFLLTVNAVNDLPSISDIANQSTTTNTPTTALAFTVGDVETAAGSLTVSGTSSNATLVPNANLVFGGSGASRTLTVTPAANQSGTATITVTVTDAGGATATDTFILTVIASTKFFVVDSTADKTFQYQSSGAYSSQTVLTAGNTNSRGIATNSNGSTFWVLDSNKTVYVYNSAMTLLGSWGVGTVKTPTGISVSGSDVWLVDSNTDQVYVFAGAATRLSGTGVAPTRSFALNASNGNAQDLVTDGATVWVVQAGTQSSAPDKVFVYQGSNGASLGNWTIDAANTSPTGITLDPTGASTSLWTVDSTTDRVYEYTNGRSRLSGSQTASVSFALNSGNGNAQGIADPAPFVSAAAEPSAVALPTNHRTQVSHRTEDSHRIASAAANREVFDALHLAATRTKIAEWASSASATGTSRKPNEQLFMELQRWNAVLDALFADGVTTED